MYLLMKLWRKLMSNNFKTFVIKKSRFVCRHQTSNKFYFTAEELKWEEWMHLVMASNLQNTNKQKTEQSEACNQFFNQVGLWSVQEHLKASLRKSGDQFAHRTTNWYNVTDGSTGSWNWGLHIDWCCNGLTRHDPRWVKTHIFYFIFLFKKGTIVDSKIVASLLLKVT